ncbi:hypothetical protein GGR53DRAFT_130190 [Hypoxylon sp. FL1150]|nr:hypothetical protein GGR53DRAFT_130190 [Hypoxylon sp. FL1150]
MASQVSTESEPVVEFHLFPRLPLELRREIYILATPPRVVNLEEGASRFDTLLEFSETCRTTPVQLRLHPDIAYFACNWQPIMTRDLADGPLSTLESYGFTCTGKRYQPWLPTKDTPEIPIAWLAENPSIAWEMTRDAYLHSPAPIPPFLHVCSESREVLRRYGYELAFGTRTHDALTWFNFERDTLHLSRDHETFENETLENETFETLLLSGGEWDVGLFRPTDLQRVKKLALGEGISHIPSSELMAMAMDKDMDMSSWTSPITSLLLLLPAIEELFFITWEPWDITHWITHDFSDQYPTLHLETNSNAGLENRLVCVPIDEVDTVITGSPGCHTSIANNFPYSDLVDFKESGTRGRFFEAKANLFQSLLAEELQKVTVSASGSIRGLLYFRHATAFLGPNS